MAPGSIGPVGGGQPHDNMHPFQVISFIISLFGAFPSQT
jgi:microcystin-dependent protein